MLIETYISKGKNNVEMKMKWEKKECDAKQADTLIFWAVANYL